MALGVRPTSRAASWIRSCGAVAGAVVGVGTARGMPRWYANLDVDVKVNAQCGRSSRGLGHHQYPDLGHVLDGVAHAFTSQAGVLDAPIGHVVDAVHGNVIDDHAADLEVLEGMPRMRQVVGEHARLESER